jgi:hypothetical protein
MGLLAYGRWSQYIQLAGPAEEEKMEEELTLRGARGRGGLTSEQLLDLARDRRAAMSAILPLNTPDDLVLVSSPRVRQSVQSEVQDERNWRPSAQAYTEIARDASLMVLHITGVEYPELGTPDSLHDHLVAMAAQASAPLVTEDPRLVPQENSMCELTDRHTGRPAFAQQLWTFLERNVNKFPFSLDDVPLELLEVSIRSS